MQTHAYVSNDLGESWQQFSDFFHPDVSTHVLMFKKTDKRD